MKLNLPSILLQSITAHSHRLSNFCLPFLPAQTHSIVRLSRSSTILVFCHNWLSRHAFQFSPLKTFINAIYMHSYSIGVMWMKPKCVCIVNSIASARLHWYDTSLFTKAASTQCWRNVFFFFFFLRGRRSRASCLPGWIDAERKSLMSSSPR